LEGFDINYLLVTEK